MATSLWGNGWTRLPTHGPWHDWDHARSWALKLEWQKEAKSWTDCDITASPAHVFEARTPELQLPGAFNTYAHGVAMFLFLQQIQLERVGARLDVRLHRRHIEKGKMDRFRQTVDIVNVVPPNQVKRASLIKDEGQLRQDMHCLGLNVWGPFGQLDRVYRTNR
ncbi:hypothetical protein HRR83_003653 [Exophiala dermatitidis]|uniref:Uncharacterized protein n=2 Tax=Exophiala dermatitidis TaxID=5970 RepID=H6BSZ8_EXODN|nr:uncharacterized protein HMPREF1120_01640 [Exophiala dermatitidis NIH/UT8656]KAJ4519038.1 hypothetical protein HRR75_002716 [Exophiala dermatitidis]EHY53447.1 hypothetical protein HMPREF1120_01640 [Exophiala dermatitidis NIH/UT8656]KAJ4522382.1 hypothetical protein HRR74_002967 [Exophiala dermatitidis]KAJ4529707.1 hypothetical protein HRR73_000735 [Exophiala dermatitidis]KAJ4543128.1 hypothetical protein HRR77_005386 [Exophiala dermatitidis]